MTSLPGGLAAPCLVGETPVVEGRAYPACLACPCLERREERRGLPLLGGTVGRLALGLL